MTIIGIYRDQLCVVLEGARIVVEAKLSKDALDDLKRYEELPVFDSWEQVDAAAWGGPEED